MSRAPSFRVELQHHDGWVCLQLDGSLDAPAAIDLNAAAWPLLGRYDGDQIVFDCARLTRLDDAGAAELVRLSRALGPTERPVLRDLPAAFAPSIPDLDAHFQREASMTEAPRR